LQLQILAKWPAGTGAFVALSLASVIVPLAEAWTVSGLGDLAYVATIFSILLLVEFLAIRIAARISQAVSWGTVCVRLFLTALLVVNVGYFLAITINADRIYLGLALGVLGAAYWISFRVAAVNRFLTAFACVFALISLAKASYESFLPFEPPPAPHGSEASTIPREASRNIYVISFDALTSRVALRAIYGINEHPHVSTLAALGFRVTDTLSAGIDTHHSLGKMFSLGGEFQFRVVRSFFNGIRPVPLYERLRQNGYRIQFIFANDYFGLDVGRLDYFYPAVASPSICEFIDGRYGVFACRPWFRRFLREQLGLRVLGGSFRGQADRAVEFERILERIRWVADRTSREKWFTFSHFYFPGHASHRYDDIAATRAYVREMQSTFPELGEYFRRLVAEIKARDPDPVIIIFGDHGGWTTLGAIPGDRAEGNVLSEELIQLDRRGALLAVYPSSFCADVIDHRADMSLLFSDVIDCLH